jgi:hypothetical protein
VRGELQLMQIVDQDIVGGLELLVAEVPLGRPRSSGTSAYLSPRRKPDRTPLQTRFVATPEGYMATKSY